MAKNNPLQNFVKNILSEKETNTLKGGRSYEPNLTGSYGWVNWDDVTVRNPNIVVTSDDSIQLNSRSNG